MSIPCNDMGELMCLDLSRGWSEVLRPGGNWCAIACAVTTACYGERIHHPPMRVCVRVRGCAWWWLCVLFFLRRPPGQARGSALTARDAFSCKLSANTCCCCCCCCFVPKPDKEAYSIRAHQLKTTKTETETGGNGVSRLRNAPCPESSKHARTPTNIPPLPRTDSRVLPSQGLVVSNAQPVLPSLSKLAALSSSHPPPTKCRSSQVLAVEATPICPPNSNSTPKNTSNTSSRSTRSAASYPSSTPLRC